MTAPPPPPSPPRSWVASANAADTDFPLSNLPLCVFKPRGGQEPFRPGAAIGDRVVPLAAAIALGALGDLPDALVAACDQPVLNPLFALGRNGIGALRDALWRALEESAPLRERLAPCLLAQVDVEYAVPCAVGDYTDFFTSLDHATNVGKQFRPDHPVFPNFTALPVAYHSRSSSLVISGVPVTRPRGQFRPAPDAAVQFGPTRKLDLEMEIGAFICGGNAHGEPIPLDQAEQHIAGLCLVNDWSARDIQAWEAQPLGPFLAKNFATTLSPWVVTLDALEPYRVPARQRGAETAPLAAYLDDADNQRRGAYAIHVETHLRTARMRREGTPAQRISAALFSRDGYWTLGQMVAHHTVNGCNLRAGDLIASGTLSGPTQGSQGCLMELTHGGAAPLLLDNGETRSYLEDGDEITLSAYCGGDGQPRIGFGGCSALVLPARGAGA